MWVHDRMVPYSAAAMTSRHKGGNNGDEDNGDDNLSMVQMAANATLLADNRRKHARYPIEIRKVREDFLLGYLSSND